jgi:hypothetical protein
MSEFFTWLSNNSVAGTTLIILVGLVVITTLLIYSIAFFQGREISFWPPAIGQKPNKAESKKTILPKSKSNELRSVLPKGTIALSGLSEVVFQTSDIPWDDLFASVNELDMFFSYASQWRTLNEVRLLKLSEKRGAKIRLILPDTTNSVVVEDLAKRFNKSPDRLKGKVDEAREQFEHLAQRAGASGAKIEIYLYSMSPHYALYRFDDTYIFSLYQQQPDKTYVPHFICNKGGQLANFFDTEIDALVSERASRRIK